MKVCENDEVKQQFTNPENENETLGQCANLVWISEKFHASLVKRYCQKQF